MMGLVSRLGDRLNLIAGLEKPSDFRPAEMFSEVIKRHPDEEVEAYFTVGSATTTPQLLVHRRQLAPALDVRADAGDVADPLRRIPLGLRSVREHPAVARPDHDRVGRGAVRAADLLLRSERAPEHLALPGDQAGGAGRAGLDHHLALLLPVDRTLQLAGRRRGRHHGGERQGPDPAAGGDPAPLPLDPERAAARGRGGDRLRGVRVRGLCARLRPPGQQHPDGAGHHHEPGPPQRAGRPHPVDRPGGRGALAGARQPEVQPRDVLRRAVSPGLRACASSCT